MATKKAAKKVAKKSPRKEKVLTPAKAAGDRKDELLNAGAKLMGKHGKAKLTRRAIAQAVGVSDALVGHYLGKTANMRNAVAARARKLGIKEPAVVTATTKVKPAKGKVTKVAKAPKAKAAKAPKPKAAKAPKAAAKPKRRATDVTPLPMPPLPPVTATAA